MAEADCKTGWATHFAKLPHQSKLDLSPGSEKNCTENSKEPHTGVKWLQSEPVPEKCSQKTLMVRVTSQGTARKSPDAPTVVAS